MTAPADPGGDDRAASPEPVAVSHAVQALLVVLAAGSWSVLDSTQLSAIITAAATVAGVAVTLVTRGRVRALRPGDTDEVDLNKFLDDIRDEVREAITATVPAAVHAEIMRLYAPDQAEQQPQQNRRYLEEPDPAPGTNTYGGYGLISGQQEERPPPRGRGDRGYRDDPRDPPYRR